MSVRREMDAVIVPCGAGEELRPVGAALGAALEAGGKMPLGSTVQILAASKPSLKHKIIIK